MKRRGCCSLLGLGKNSTDSDSVSQWKTFRFFNVVLHTGPCPALAPRTTHTHMCTLAQAQGSTSHPSLLGSGDGCILLPTPAEQKRGRSVADTQPEASSPVREQNAYPGCALSPRGWVGHRGKNWTRDFSGFCASSCQAILSHSGGVVCNSPSSLSLYEKVINTGLSLLDVQRGHLSAEWSGLHTAW